MAFKEKCSKLIEFTYSTLINNIFLSKLKNVDKF